MAVQGPLVAFTMTTTVVAAVTNTLKSLFGAVATHLTPTHAALTRGLYVDALAIAGSLVEMMGILAQVILLLIVVNGIEHELFIIITHSLWCLLCVLSNQVFAQYFCVIIAARCTPAL